MKLKYDNVRFKLVNKKTKKPIYSCINNKQNCIVGLILWYTPFNSYYYFPNKNTAYGSKCLNEISDFTNQLNKQ